DGGCHAVRNGSFFFSSRRRHTRWPRDWSSDVCSSDLGRRTRTHDHFNRYFVIPPSAGALLEADDLDRTMGAGGDRCGNAPQQEALDPAHPFCAEKYAVRVPLLGFVEQHVLGVAVL